MKPELQRIAIAKACGWTEITHIHDGKSPKGYFTTLPDYLNDLNAMHEAEKSVKNFHRYGNILSKVVLGFTGEPETITLNYWALTRIAGATAAQRAEAFLRTLHLWTES